MLSLVTAGSSLVTAGSATRRAPVHPVMSLRNTVGRPDLRQASTPHNAAARQAARLGNSGKSWVAPVGSAARSARAYAPNSYASAAAYAPNSYASMDVYPYNTGFSSERRDSAQGRLGWGASVEEARFGDSHMGHVWGEFYRPVSNMYNRWARGEFNHRSAFDRAVARGRMGAARLGWGAPVQAPWVDEYDAGAWGDYEDPLSLITRGGRSRRRMPVALGSRATAPAAPMGAPRGMTQAQAAAAAQERAEAAKEAARVAQEEANAVADAARAEEAAVRQQREEAARAEQAAAAARGRAHASAQAAAEDAARAQEAERQLANLRPMSAPPIQSRTYGASTPPTPTVWTSAQERSRRARDQY